MTNRLTRALLASAAGFALLAGGSARALAQGPTVISGRVVSDAGAPIAGASVSIDVLRLSTATRDDGSFTLTVPAGRTGQVTVTVRRIGFKLSQRPVTLAGAPMTQAWTLESQAQLLTGIMVTALSIQREKTTIGTSQQAITAEDLTRTQTPSIVSAMSGKVSGVTITGSGNIGGSARIVIRGQGSITGNNQPLFVVDGIPVSNDGYSTASASGGRDYGTGIADLNAGDISSMTVLKGPNAAALYGSRASNGAVVITTRSGRAYGEGTRFTFTSRMTADQISILPKYQNRYGQGFGGEFQYVDGAGSGVNDGADESWGPKLDGRPIDQFTGKQQPWIAHPNNVKDYFQLGSSVSNNINVAAASRTMSARLSITKEDVKGIVPNSSLAKLAAVVSAGAQVNDKLTVSGTAQWVRNNGMNRPENGYTEGNPFMTYTWFGRQVDVAALKAKYYNKDSPYGFADGSLFNWNDNYHRNPYWQQYENPAPDSRERFIGQVSANFTFKPWLTAVLRTGNDSWRFVREERFAAGNIDRANASYNGGFTAANSRASESNFEGIVTARKSLGSLELTANAGGNIRRNDSFNNAYSTSGILVPGIYNLSNAGITPTFTNSEAHTAVNSAYGSVIATLKQYWTVEVTGRNDWSSTLPKENASYFYPSVSTSLVVSDLFPGLTSNGWLSYAKLRGGWAQVGADAGAYQLQTLYLGDSRKFSGQALYSLSNISANAFLKPERTTGQEGGVELSFFNDLVTLDATYYLKVSRDQIMNLTVAPATGFSLAAINAGQISNRGIEALLTARPVKLANSFQWTTSFNFSYNRNKVDQLTPGLSTVVLAGQWGATIEAREGEPWGVIWGNGWRRDSTTGKLLLSGGLPQRNTTKRILGNVNPDWVGGWGNEVRYKNYTLNTLVDIRSGGQNFSIGNWWGMYAGILESTLKGREVDWDKPGLIVEGTDEDTGQPNTTVVTAEDYAHNLYPTHEPAILPTGFIKLREVKFTWDVPANLLTKLKLAQMSVALVGRNLWTKSDFPNYDPENSTNAGNGGQGFDMGAMSTVRSFGLNITITP